MSVGNGRQARPNLAYGEVRILSRQCFVLLSLLACLGCTGRSVRLASTSTPRSERCGGALDIQSPGRPRACSEGYGVSVVHVTCSYGYE